MDNQNPYDSPHAEPQPEIVGQGGLTQDERTWGMLAHLSAIIAAVFTGFLGGWVGPLIVWLIKKDESQFVDDQGKESLNFQITLIIWYVVAYAITFATCGLAFFVLFVPIVLQLVFCIIATIRANEGQYYRYPMTIRMIT